MHPTTVLRLFVQCPWKALGWHDMGINLWDVDLALGLRLYMKGYDCIRFGLAVLLHGHFHH